MIEGASIVCFAHDWGGDPTSKTHIMRILSERNRIVWVNSVGMRRPRLSGRDIKRLFAKVGGALKGVETAARNLWVVNPMAVPIPGAKAISRVNASLLSWQLRSACRRYGLDRPILWTFLPNVVDVVGRLNERLVIYHCVDEYSAFSGVSREALIRMEQQLIRRADLVVTSSEQLCEERRALNANTHFVSHGVDVTHFGRALEATSSAPDDMRDMPRPIIGFVGLIADWLDLDLVRRLAIARRDWSFVLVGKSVTETNMLNRLPNVYLLGQKPYSAVPAYCGAFDVGIIPFRVNQLTLRANPLKLREYLAAGLPVVATDLPEIRRYGHVVRLAGGADGFIREIEHALFTRDEASVRRRVEAVKGESWEARVEELSHLIRPLLDNR